MTTEITMMDRDEFIEAARVEHEEIDNEGEIARLRRAVVKAQEDLTLSEQALAAIEESLAGKKSEALN
jgi:hypothetical protein